MKRVLIVNGELVNEGKRFFSDIYIKNGRIERIGKNLSACTYDEIIDASGKIVIPGMIDDQVHFREPGLTHKGTIETESKAAIAGGITSFMEMPNTKPLAVNQVALESKYEIASKKSFANYSFYLGATNDNLDEIKKVDSNTVCGIKIFMGASTGDMLVDNKDTLNDIFREAPILVATHCEDTPTIQKNERYYREKYNDEIPIELHPKIRSEEACYQSSSLAVGLAKKYGTKLHVLHLTTEKELSLFSSEKSIEKKPITAEVCVHHLFFDERDYTEKGTLIKCNPSIKTQRDKEALQKALVEGKLDIIATDHAPHTWEEKKNSYLKAPSGLPLVQHALPTLFELFFSHVLSLELIVEKTSHNVAKRFEVLDRGFLREGYFADITIVDLNKKNILINKDILYQCGWSPFEGITFRTHIDATIVSGNIVYQDGKFHPKYKGQRLLFER